MYPKIHIDNPSAVACAPDGTLYWAETGSNRVCRVGSDNKVEILMEGPPRSHHFRGGKWKSDKPVLAQPSDLLYLPDDTLLVADAGNHCIWRIKGLK